jgi:hypothetical protein
MVDDVPAKAVEIKKWVDENAPSEAAVPISV